MKRLFELDAAVPDADLGIGLLWKGLEVTAIDGTTMELARNDVLDGEFGTPADGARPLLRVTAHVRTATFRWIGAAIGGYHDGENALADQLEGSFRPGILNLADRGFFSMDRCSGSPPPARTWPGGSRTARNPSRSRPSRPCPTALSWSCCTNQTACGPAAAARPGTRSAERLPDTTARLVTFTVTAMTSSGRAKTTRLRVLTTLLDHEAYPPAEIAALYAERWQIEIAFLHLKQTVRGPRRPLRGQSPELARQEAWALLLIHNITATAAARAADPPGSTPGSSRSPPCSASSAPTSPRTPAAGTAGTARQRRCPAGQPERRDPRPAPPPARTPADIRQNSRRTTNPAHRRSHLHHRHHKVESPKMGHNSGNLRAVGPRQVVARRGTCPPPGNWLLH